MGKPVNVYFSDEEEKKLQVLLDKQEKKFGKRNASDLIKTALFERRERKKSTVIQTNDLVFQSQIKSKVSSIIGDYQAGRDIIMALRTLEALASSSLEKV